jgi:hypothetical protein
MYHFKASHSTLSVFELGRRPYGKIHCCSQSPAACCQAKVSSQVALTYGQSRLLQHHGLADLTLNLILQVLPCPLTEEHCQEDCPYAHPSEKATRRDPRVYPYTGVSCPSYRKVCIGWVRRFVPSGCARCSRRAGADVGVDSSRCCCLCMLS